MDLKSRPDDSQSSHFYIRLLQIKIFVLIWKKNTVSFSLLAST